MHIPCNAQITKSARFHDVFGTRIDFSNISTYSEFFCVSMGVELIKISSTSLKSI